VTASQAAPAANNTANKRAKSTDEVSQARGVRKALQPACFLDGCFAQRPQPATDAESEKWSTPRAFRPSTTHNAVGPARHRDRDSHERRPSWISEMPEPAAPAPA
jgi:hypothetical protein